jgi:UDP-2,3-diacylglucosamine pyrophosphatase LpxH
MPAPTITDDEFIRAWELGGGSPKKVAQILATAERFVYKKRSDLAGRGIILKSVPIKGATKWSADDVGRAYKRQIDLEIDTGCAIAFSDAHFWPNQPRTVANEALLILTKELKPRTVFANGDIFDGARVSRHAPLGWSELPSVKEELETCQDRMAEIEDVLPKGCTKIWNVGNHDARFDRALVTNAAEYEGVISRLDDKFDRWDFAWSTMVNENVMVKHRYHNGIHATYNNNTLKSGRSIVTGHLHRLAVTPWADYNGRRYGVDTGTLSNPHGPQFDYAENNPSPHTSGFAILHFKDGMLLPPELVEVINDKAYFRGECVFDGTVDDV